MRILFLDDDQNRHTIFRRESDPRDDVHYVYTARQAKETLDAEPPFDLAMLDHDLADEHYLTFGQEAYSPGTGMEVVDHIVGMRKERRPKLVEVHSFNTVRAPEMVTRLKEAGVPARWRRFGMR